VAEDQFSINAWIPDGTPATSPATRGVTWALGPAVEATDTLAETPPAPSDWRHPDVGWGLILAADADIPEPIQELLRTRPNSPVFRYKPDWNKRFEFLSTSNGDVPIINPEIGIAPGQLPAYLLIYGSPEEIPWTLQYALNASTKRSVGRLDLTNDALENYVWSLINGWKDSQLSFGSAVTWAVDFGASDITRLMRDSIAAKIHDQLSKSPVITNATFIDGVSVPATCQALINALNQQKPGLIVTTSHGQTASLPDREEMLAALGLPVGQDRKAVESQMLLSSWQPDGAVWYSHACCSAGNAKPSVFSDLVMPDSGAAQALEAVAPLGTKVAPLPQALLGAKKPLRAFVGHVEPTFNWTLAHPKTGQYMTGGLVRAIAKQLVGQLPIGYSFQDLFGTISPARTLVDDAQRAYSRGEDTEEIRRSMIRMQLLARDIESTVILGDPTATLPTT
jgi:hypothetical protein